MKYPTRYDWTAYVTLAVIGLVLIFSNAAHAAPPPEGYGAAALKVAYRYWGTEQPPLCTSETIHWGEDPPMWPTRGAAATAPTQPEACVMWVGKLKGVYDLCMTVVHEYSHWMGYQWGTDPRAMTYDGSVVGSDSDLGAPWKPKPVRGCQNMVF